MSKGPYKQVGEGYVRSSPRRIRRKMRKVKESRVHRRASMVIAGTLGSLALLALLSVVVVVVLKRKKVNESDRLESMKRYTEIDTGLKAESAPSLVDQEEVEEGAEKLNQAISKITAFIEASEAEDIVKLIRDPERHRQAVQQFFQESDLTGMRVLKRENKEIDGKKYLRCLVGLQGRYRVLDLDWETGLFDWESFVVTNCGDQEELEKWAMRPEGVPYRCQVLFGFVAEYFNFDYRKEDNWLCLRLMHPEFEDSWWAYVKEGSPAWFEISQMIGDTEEGVMDLVLQIRFTSEQNLKRRQAEVLDLRARSWRIPQHSRIKDLLGELGEIGGE